MSTLEAAPATDADPITVGVVDDDPWLRRTLTMLLQTQPRVRLLWTTDTAEDALARVEAQPPDLLLPDIELPGMSGLEAAQRLRATHPDLKLLIVSLHTEAEYPDLGRTVDVEGFVHKSALARELPATIGRLGHASA